jgi:hypothetical protein
MPDNITNEEFASLVSDIRRLTGSIDQLARGNSKSKGGGARQQDNKDRQRQQEQERRRVINDKYSDERFRKTKSQDAEMARGASLLGRSLSTLEGNAGKVGEQLIRMAEGVPKIGLTLGVVATQIMSFGGHLTKNYRDVADAGQLFQGSMMNMAQAAADAGLPMDQFAEMVKKNSKLMSVFGVKDVGQMAKQVRTMTAQQGMYGYTVDGMNEVTMSYLDIQRQFNVKVESGNAQHVKNIAHLAETTTTLAAAFGTTREEILKNTAEAMKEFTGLYISTLGQSKSEVAQKTAKATEVMEVISNMPVVGKDMVKALDTSVRMGSATMDENWRNIATKFPELTSEVDNLGAKMRNGSASMGDGIEMMVKTRDILQRNAANIQFDQSEAGAKAREMLQQLNALDLGDDGANFKKRMQSQKEAADNMKGITKILLDLHSGLDLLKSGFLKGVYEGFGKLDEKLNDPRWKAAFDDLKSAFESAGQSVGNAIKAVFTETNMKTMGDGVRILGIVVSGLVRGASLLMNAFTGIVKFAQLLGKPFGRLGENIMTLVGVIGSVMLAMRAWGVAKRMMGFGMKNMMIRAQTVIVNGGKSFGGGGGFGGKGGGKGGPARGPGGRFAKTAEAGKGMFGGLSKFAKGGKILGKMGGILVPGAGAVIDGIAAADAHKRGNNLAAMLYGAGGVVNGVGAGLDATVIGAVAGFPLDLIGGLLSGAGLGADVLGIGQKKPGAAIAKTGGGSTLGAAMLTNSLTGSMPGAPVDGNGDLIDETKRQTDAIQDGFGDSPSKSDPPDPFAPRTVELLETLRNMNEASLVMQKEMLEIARKSNGLPATPAAASNQSKPPR